jgi:aspartokinase/homoserine dehydrogenase 1
LEDLINFHLQVVKNLIKSEVRQRETLVHVHKLLNDLRKILEGVFLIKELSPKTLDLVASFGERLAAYVISQILIDSEIPAVYIDSRKLIKTNSTFGYAHINFERTNRNIQKFIEQLQKEKKGVLPVLPGFIGSTSEDETTTLGRGGSDYSSTIFGAALDSTQIDIWSNVDGVMTADPKKVPSAFTIDKMS